MVKKRGKERLGSSGVYLSVIRSRTLKNLKHDIILLDKGICSIISINFSTSLTPYLFYYALYTPSIPLPDLLFTQARFPSLK